MKKRIMLLFCMLSVCMPMNVFANSRTTNGLTETEKLGITAGAALACGVDREQLLNYEMIASRVIANPISSEEVEKKAMQEYATAKLKAFKEQKKQSLSTCPEILERFENQEIFRSVVYRDGTLKLPNGETLKPKRPLKVNKKKK